MRNFKIVRVNKNRTTFWLCGFVLLKIRLIVVGNDGRKAFACA